MMIVPFRCSQINTLCFVCLKEALQRFRDETTGAISANWHFHCNSEAIVFSQIGDASYECQPEHGTHSYGCISRGFARPQLSLCALRKQLLRANNSRTVS